MDSSEPRATTDAGSARRPWRALIVGACVLGLLLAASGVPALSPPVETNDTEGAIKDTVNGAADELGLADFEGNLTVEDPSELEGLSGLARDITIKGDVVIEDPGDLNGNVTAGNVTVEGDVIVENPEEWTREDVENLPDGVTADDLRVEGDHQRSQLPTIDVDDTPFESTDDVPEPWVADEEDDPLPSGADDDVDTPGDIEDGVDDQQDEETNDSDEDSTDDPNDGSDEDDETNDDESTSDDDTNDGTDDGTTGDGTDDGTSGDETGGTSNGDGTGGDGTTGGGDGTDQTGSNDESPIDVSLEDDPVPGQEVTLVVTEDGEPLENAHVTFNGESVGTTGADGRVSGEVPYSTELRIGVQPSSDSQTSDDEASGSGSLTASSDGDTATSTSGAVASESRQAASAEETTATSDAAVSDGWLARSDGRVLQQEESNRTITMELPSDVAVTVVGDRYQGAQVVVRATLGGRPLAEANVSVNGRELATTDADGTATVRLPDADRANVTVERGQITGETELDLQQVSVTVDADPAALPTRSATVRVTANGSPVEDATVTLDGEAVATTDDNGTATVTLPADPGATIGVGEDGRLASTTVNPVRNLAIAGGAALLSLVGGLLVARWLAHRRGVALRAVPATAGASAAELGTRTLDTIVEGLRRGGHALWWLTALPRWALASFFGSSEPADVAEEQAGGADVAAPMAARSSDPDGTVGAIRTAWATLVAALPIDRPATRTPAEIAERAIEVGVPADAVETVLDAYRSVEYGAASPDPALAERVRAAVDRATETEGDRG